MNNSEKNTVLQIGNQIKIFTGNVSTAELLPGHVYSVHNSIFGPYLNKEAAFKDPENFIYEEEDFHNHILNSFQSFDSNCGVVLQGKKGQGKSVSAKKLAMRSNLPIITINKKIESDFDIISFLDSIPCQYVLMIDEFEKLFEIGATDGERNNSKNTDYANQDIFLSFLDGARSTEYKKLIILTCNNNVSDFLINRPGRIRFKKNYNFLTETFYNLLIDKYLQYPEFRQDLKNNLPLRDATVDLVKSIAGEINAAKKPYSSFKDWFNFVSTIINYSVYIYNEAEVGSSRPEGWLFYETLSTQNEIISEHLLPHKYYGGKITRLEKNIVYIEVLKSQLKQNQRDFFDVYEDEDEKKNTSKKKSDEKINFKFVLNETREEKIIK